MRTTPDGRQMRPGKKPAKSFPMGHSAKMSCNVSGAPQTEIVQLEAKESSLA
ncbi:MULTISPECIES: hypothetical protein [unclassified Roseibium]|uniref:hypothetical protein n=1 Tax=unclassified Roseibium TaxID=2629323 RepID=UPI00273F725C|nr:MULTISPECIES: hypothetical protein [unclassified Roseibium]